MSAATFSSRNIVVDDHWLSLKGKWVQLTILAIFGGLLSYFATGILGPWLAFLGPVIPTLFLFISLRFTTLKGTSAYTGFIMAAVALFMSGMTAGWITLAYGLVYGLAIDFVFHRRRRFDLEFYFSAGVMMSMFGGLLMFGQAVATGMAGNLYWSLVLNVTSGMVIKVGTAAFCWWVIDSFLPGAANFIDLMAGGG